jgi:hypothetical protein
MEFPGLPELMAVNICTLLFPACARLYDTSLCMMQRMWQCLAGQCQGGK